MNKDILQSLANESLCLLEQETIFPALIKTQVVSNITKEKPGFIDTYWVEYPLSAEEQHLPLEQIIEQKVVIAMRYLGRQIDEKICNHIITIAKIQNAIISGDTFKQAFDTLQAPIDHRTLILTVESETEYLIARAPQLNVNTYMVSHCHNYNLLFHKDAVELITYQPISESQDIWVKTDNLSLLLSVNENPDHSVKLRCELLLSVSNLNLSHCVLIPDEIYIKMLKQVKELEKDNIT